MSHADNESQEQADLWQTAQPAVDRDRDRDMRTTSSAVQQRLAPERSGKWVKCQVQTAVYDKKQVKVTQEPTAAGICRSTDVTATNTAAKEAKGQVSKGL